MLHCSITDQPVFSDDETEKQTNKIRFGRGYGFFIGYRIMLPAIGALMLKKLLTKKTKPILAIRKR